MESPAAVVAALEMIKLVAIVLLSGVICVLIAKKIKVPDIVLFLIAGMVIGPELFSLVELPAATAVNQFILFLGAAYIIFDGGLATRLAVLNRVWLSLIILATIGVGITAVITGFTAYGLLDLPLMIALLLGVTLAPTDPATLVPVFKQVTVRNKVAQTAVSESAFNDATGAIIAFAMVGIIMGSGGFSVGASLFALLKEAVLGLVVGAVFGYIAAFAIGHKRFNFVKDHSGLVTLILVAFAYIVADNIHGSGFMAAFAAGIMVGNNDMFGFEVKDVDEEWLHGYVDFLALIFRMFIFILLGTHVDFGLIQQYWLAGVAIVLVFMFVARPVTVFLCTVVDRRAQWTFKERLFLSWVRETGVIPAALAGLLVGMGVPGAEVIASVTFIAILMTIVIQATTTQWLARKLDLAED